MLQLLLLTKCSTASLLTLPTPDGVLDELLRVKAAEQSVSKKKNDMLDPEAAKTLTKIKNKLNNLEGLVGIKFTLEKEIGAFGAKEFKLAEELASQAAFFIVDYRLFIELLHQKVYKQTKIQNLEIPSLIFFHAGKLLLPIEPSEGILTKESAAPIECLIKDKLKKIHSTAIPTRKLPELFF